MFFPRRSLALLAVVSLPAFVALAWAGCATGADAEAPVTPTKETGPGDDAGGDVPVDPDGNPIFDSDMPTDGGSDSKPMTETGPVDSGLKCPTAPADNKCETATEIATLAVGGKTVVSGSLSPGGEHWYKVTFTNTDDLASHPHLTLTSTDPTLVFEVLDACGGSNATCGMEDGGAAKGVTDYEKSFMKDPDAGVGPDPGGLNLDAYIPITVGTGGVVYLRVYRTGAATNCDFKIDVSN